MHSLTQFSVCLSVSGLNAPAAPHLEELGVLVLQHQDDLLMLLHLGLRRHLLQLQLLSARLLLVPLLLQLLQARSNQPMTSGRL